MQIKIEGLLNFLDEKIKSLRSQQSDAMYNVGVCDGQIQAFESIFAKIKDESKPYLEATVVPTTICYEIDARVPEALYEKVKSFIVASEMINAIKALRSATGWGLKESKDWCENLRSAILRSPLPKEEEERPF